MLSRHLHLLLAALHRAALHPSGWQDFIVALEIALPGVGVSLFGLDGNKGRVIYVTTGSGIDPAGLKLFADYYHAINPFASFLANVPPGTTRQSVADVPDEKLEQTEFYNDWMRHQDHLIGGVALRTRPHQGRSLVVGVNVRRGGREETNRKAQALLRWLEPHVSHAFHVSEVIAELNSHHLLAGSGSLMMSHGGTIICERNLTVIWADSRLMDNSVGVLWIDLLGRLRFVDPETQHWAANLVPGRMSLRLPRERQIGVWTIRALDGQVTTCASPAFPGAFRGAGWPEQQLVFVISRNAPVPSRERHLMVNFQLSAAEAAIAVLIADGHTTAEIADARQASLHTVRNQIRAVLQKMDAHDRGAIIREVMALERAPQPSSSQCGPNRGSVGPVG